MQTSPTAVYLFPRPVKLGNSSLLTYFFFVITHCLSVCCCPYLICHNSSLTRLFAFISGHYSTPTFPFCAPVILRCVSIDTLASLCAWTRHAYECEVANTLPSVSTQSIPLCSLLYRMSLVTPLPLIADRYLATEIPSHGSHNGHPSSEYRCVWVGGMVPGWPFLAWVRNLLLRI